AAARSEVRAAGAAPALLHRLRPDVVRLRPDPARVRAARHGVEGEPHLERLRRVRRARRSEGRRRAEGDRARGNVLGGCRAVDPATLCAVGRGALLLTIVCALAAPAAASADDWLPHPADATWTYQWTDSAYNTTPTLEKITVDSVKGSSFTLKWTTSDPDL